MVSRWCKNITFIVHFISNLMLLLIWQKVLVHGLEFGDSCTKEPSSFLIFFVKLTSVCILASKTIMKQLKIYKLSINSTFSLADWKSTYVIFSWHFLALFWFLVLANTFAKVKVLVTQLCPTFCNPVDCRPPGSSPHEILQARILELGSHSLLQGIFPTQELNPGLLHCRHILYVWATREAHIFPKSIVVVFVFFS